MHSFIHSFWIDLRSTLQSYCQTLTNQLQTFSQKYPKPEIKIAMDVCLSPIGSIA